MQLGTLLKVNISSIFELRRGRLFDVYVLAIGEIAYRPDWSGGVTVDCGWQSNFDHKLVNDEVKVQHLQNGGLFLVSFHEEVIDFLGAVRLWNFLRVHTLYLVALQNLVQLIPPVFILLLDLPEGDDARNNLFLDDSYQLFGRWALNRIRIHAYLEYLLHDDETGVVHFLA